MRKIIEPIIESVAANDLKTAKTYAKDIISHEKSENNKSFCNRIKAKLEAPTA